MMCYYTTHLNADIRQSAKTEAHAVSSFWARHNLNDFTADSYVLFFI